MALRENRKWSDVRSGEEGKGSQNKKRGIELDWDLRVGLSLWISKLSQMRSSWVIDEEKWERMVKSSDVVEWPVSWWCNRMFNRGLTHALPVRFEIPKWSRNPCGEVDLFGLHTTHYNLRFCISNIRWNQ